MDGCDLYGPMGKPQDSQILPPTYLSLGPDSRVKRYILVEASSTAHLYLTPNHTLVLCDHS